MKAFVRFLGWLALASAVGLFGCAVTFVVYTIRVLVHQTRYGAGEAMWGGTGLLLSCILVAPLCLGLGFVFLSIGRHLLREGRR